MTISLSRKLSKKRKCAKLSKEKKRVFCGCLEERLGDDFNGDLLAAEIVGYVFGGD